MTASARADLESSCVYLPDRRIPEAVRLVRYTPGLLSRLDRNFARYVENRLLPGWLVLISRSGRIAHPLTYGQCDIEAPLPVPLGQSR